MRRASIKAALALAYVAAGLSIFLLAGTFLPTLFGFEALIVSSGSMGRSMPVGSVALTRPIEARAVSVGDVVTYRHDGGRTTTHRVMTIRREAERVVLTTKGDANGAVDPQPVIVAGRIHRVEIVVPFAGHLVRHARSPAGGVVLFAIPIIGLTLERPLRTAGRKRARERAARDDESGWSATTFALEGLSTRGIDNRLAS